MVAVIIMTLISVFGMRIKQNVNFKDGNRVAYV